MSEKEMREMIFEEIKAEKRQYAKEWRKKNPERVKANNQRYWENRVRKRLEAAASAAAEQEAK